MLMAVCAGLALAAACPASAGNAMIRNGSFEDGPVFWELFNARIDTTPGVARSGGKCVTGWVPAHFAKYSGVRKRLDLEPGAEYETVFWAKSEAGEAVAAVWADFESDSDNRLLLATEKIPQQWTMYKVNFRARRAQSTLDFHVPQTWVGKGSKGGRAWIDDISVRRIDGPLQFPPKPWEQRLNKDETAFDPEGGYDVAPSLAIDRAGTMYLTWLRNVKGSDAGEVGEQQVLLRHRQGGEWSKPIVIADGSGRRLPPAVAATSRGAWIAWSEEKPNGRWRVMARQWPTGDKPIAVADDSSTNRAPVVTVDKAGDPWFAWETSKTGLSGVAVRKYDVKKRALGSVVYPSKHTGNGQYPAIAADGKGGIWVAWSAFLMTDYQLWVQKIGGKPVSLNIWNRDNLRPTLAAGTDRVWVAWNTSTRENPQHKQSPSYAEDPRWYAYRYMKGVGVACTDGAQWYLPPQSRAFAANNPAGDETGGNKMPGIINNVEQPCMAITASGAPLLICRTLGGARTDGWTSRALLLGADGWKQVDLGDEKQGLLAPACAVVDASGSISIAQQQDSRVSGGYFQRFDGQSWISVRRLSLPADQGGWEASLQPTSKVRQAAVAPKAARVRQAISYNGKTYKLFFGDLHIHTDMSTCAKRQQDMQDSSLKTGCYAGLLDFGSFADHGEHMNHNDWRLQNSVISANNVPGSFVAFSGEEFTSQMIGHKNIVYSDMNGRRFDSRKTETLDLWRALEPGKAITIPHHPADSAHTTDWDYYDPRFVKLVEIFQARLSHEAPDAPCVTDKNVPGSYVSDALARGYRMGFIASPDHPGKFGVAAVYATDLSREAIFDALLHKRCYAAVEPTVFLDFRVDGHLMGETIPAEPRKSPHRIAIRVETQSPIESLVLIRNGKQIKTFEQAAGSKKIDVEFVDQHPEEAPAIGAPGEKTVFYYVRVVEQGERKNMGGIPYKHIAWSSPVWITLDPEPSGVTDYKVLEPQQ